MNQSLELLNRSIGHIAAFALLLSVLSLVVAITELRRRVKEREKRVLHRADELAQRVRMSLKEKHSQGSDAARDDQQRITYDKATQREALAPDGQNNPSEPTRQQQPSFSGGN